VVKLHQILTHIKNYDQVTTNATITIAANKNYFLKGPITVASGITWTISGGTLKYNIMPYIGRGLQTGEYKLITLSESFDGSRVDFTMSESVPSERVLMVILSGILQHWGESFTVNGTTLTFSEPPSNGENNQDLKN
jgi:hypothetical protein